MLLNDYGFSLRVRLSARDTEDWATYPGRAWPCSTLRGKRISATFDTNGLCDLSIDGKDAPDDIDGDELSAIIADHLDGAIPVDHPIYFVAVGQFK